jgi:hypothetical protein
MLEDQPREQLSLALEIADESITVIDNANDSLQTKANRITLGVLTATSTLGAGCLLPIEGATLSYTQGIIVALLALVGATTMWVASSAMSPHGVIAPVGKNLTALYDEVVNQDIESAYGAAIAYKSLQIDEAILVNGRLSVVNRRLMDCAKAQMLLVIVGVLAKAFSF